MSDLFLLTIDSLRSDHFGPATFSECWSTFETDFVRFENALANGVATPLSFPSLLTGHPVDGDGRLPRTNPTMAELYDGHTWAVTNNPHLRADRNYDRGFDVFADDLETYVAERVNDCEDPSDLLDRTIDSRGGEPDLTPPPTSAEHVLATLREAMAEHEGFFWTHFIDPHYQFKPQKNLDRHLDIGYSNAEILAMNERYVDGDPDAGDLEFLSWMYEELVAYLDRQLAAFFEHLRMEGRWEDATIVVAVDHGEAFGEHGVYNHQWDADPIDPLIRVPLLIKFPGGEGGGTTYDHLVGNADVFTTLAKRFEWDVDWPPHTRPLTDPGSRIVISKSNTAVRVTTPNGAAVRRRDGSVDADSSIDADAKSALETASIPGVEKLSGNVPGLDADERRNVEQRLEDLGYR